VAQFLKEGKNSKDFIEMLSNETARLSNLVNDFLMFSRPADAPKEEVDVSDMIRIIIARNDSEKKIVSDIEDGVTISANRMLIEVALTNVIRNAMEAAQSAVFVKMNRFVSDMNRSKREVVLEVEDDGQGIDKSIRDRIFEPFFTTKPTGTGLGLAITYRVITSFGGYIIADDSPKGGAKLTIVLPDENRQNEKDGS
jgi:signal transduction histidine kinase